MNERNKVETMIKQKWNSTSGASLLIALFFLLLCAIVGSIILTSASVASGRFANLKEVEQSYYSVSSASKLLKAELEGEKYSKYEIISKDGIPLENEYYALPQNKMKEFLIKGVEQVMTSQTEYSDIFTIYSSEQVMEEVTAYFSMDPQYNISITVTQGRTKCMVTIPAVYSENTETILYEDSSKEEMEGIRITKTILWTEGEIS